MQEVYGQCHKGPRRGEEGQQDGLQGIRGSRMQGEGMTGGRISCKETAEKQEVEAIGFCGGLVVN